MSNTTHNHLICFLGRNGSGKSYKANQLVKDQNYVKVSMADALRELAWKTLGWRPKDGEDYSKFKNSLITEGLVETDSDGDDTVTFTGNIEITGRQFLQNLGQGAKTLFGEDFWVKQWEKKVSDLTTYDTKTSIDIPNNAVIFHEIKERRKIVTDDIRFPIEIEAAHKLAATFIWCDYQQGDYPIEEHSSEALANRILVSGKYKDGDEIGYEDLKTFF